MKTICVLIGVYLYIFNLCNNMNGKFQRRNSSFVTRNTWNIFKKKKQYYSNPYNSVMTFIKPFGIHRDRLDTYMLGKSARAQKRNILPHKNKNVLFYSNSSAGKFFKRYRYEWFVQNGLPENELKNSSSDFSKHTLTESSTDTLTESSTDTLTESSEWEKLNKNEQENHLKRATSEMNGIESNQQTSKSENEKNKDNETEQKMCMDKAIERAKQYIEGRKDTIISDREKGKAQEVIDHMKEKEKVFSDEPLDLRLYDVLKYVYNEHVYENSKLLVNAVFTWMKNTYFDFIKEIRKNNKSNKKKNEEEENMVEREITSNIGNERGEQNLINTFFFKKSTNETKESNEIQTLKMYNQKDLNKYFFSFNKGNILKQLVTEGEDEECLEQEKKKKMKKKICDYSDKKYDEEIKKTLSYPIFQMDEENYVDKYRYLRSNVTIEFNIYDIQTDTIMLNNKRSNATMLEFPLLNCNDIIQKCIMTMKKLEKAIFYIKNEYFFKRFNYEYVPPDVEYISHNVKVTEESSESASIQKDVHQKDVHQKDVQDEGNRKSIGENEKKEQAEEKNQLDEESVYKLIKTNNWIKLEIYLCNIYEIDEQWIGISPEMFSNEKEKEEFFKEYSISSSDNILKLDGQNSKSTKQESDRDKDNTTGTNNILPDKHLEKKEKEKQVLQGMNLKEQQNEITNAEVNLSERQKEILKRSEEYEQKKEIDIKTDLLMRKLENEMKYNPDHYMWKDLYPNLSEHHKQRTDKYFSDLKKEMSENKYSRGYTENIKKKQSLKGYDLGEKIEGKSKYFVWTENIHGFTLYIPLKYHVKKKDVTIDIDNNFLFLSINKYTIVKDFFANPINADDSIWSFGDSSVFEHGKERTLFSKENNTVNENLEKIDNNNKLFPVYHVSNIDEEVKHISKKYFCLIYQIYKDNNHKYMWGSIFKQS